MSEKSKGFCKYCGKEYTKGGMLRHLNSCKNREESFKDENKRSKQGYFQISITGKEDKDYWLIIEVNEKATLKELDHFLRAIWLECCGHLSSFRIDGESYDIVSDDDENSYFMGMLGLEPSKDMNHKLKDVLSVGKKFTHQYDFGSTTELELKVEGHRVGGKKLDDEIEILSRNNPPQFICQKCRKNEAKWIVPEGMAIDNNIFWCDECLERDDSPEYVLPVCNSPRMGVCAYEGSIFYPEQFEPDVVVEIDEVKNEENDDVEEEKYKKDNKGRLCKRVEFNIYEDKPKERSEEDATIDQWRELYDVATRISELKPWEKIMSKDVIAIKSELYEDVLYFKIKGLVEILRGVELFEGEEEFNTLLGEYGYEKLNIPMDYAIYSRKNIAFYWSDREFLKEKQRRIIKELGYKYRGKGNWLNFVKAEPGYDFLTLNKEEVVSTTEKLKLLEIALNEYKKSQEKFNNLSSKIFYIELKADGSVVECKFKPFSVNDYVFEEVTLEKEDYRLVLQNEAKNKSILELDMFITDELYYDRDYNKYINPIICIFLENRIKANKIDIKPVDDMIMSIVDEFVRYIILNGKPSEVHVSNAVLEIALREMCKAIGVKLKLKKYLSMDRM